MGDNEIVKALYSMYRATVYKDTITMSKETAIGLYEYFNRQKAEIERLMQELQYPQANTVQRLGDTSNDKE